MTISYMQDPQITVNAMPDYKRDPFIAIDFGPTTFGFGCHLTPAQAAELAGLLTAAVAEFPVPPAGGDL